VPKVNDKERVHAALEGKPVDRMPVTVLYKPLYDADHFSELTSRPQPELWKWRYASPEEHLETFRAIVKKTPLDIIQPQSAPSRQARENTEFVEKNDEFFLRDKRKDSLRPLKSVSGHPVDYRANETQYVFDRKDADERIKVTKAEKIVASGCNDYIEAAVAAFGNDRFLMAGGVVGILWSCHGHVGQTNMLAMLVQQPDLVEYMSKKLLEQTIESIRAFASAGTDAIYIDDAMGTSDVISPAHYERFCLPYVREMVSEIHNLGHKAIVIYFGGVADRLDLIASTGADGLSVETTMKNYVNDMGEIAETIGDRISLFGNLDPIRVLEKGTDEALRAEVKRQAKAGRKARGFIMCTGSPVTPRTPLARVQRFIELGRRS
jgi:uroporphyrinogen-III decarboxylase